MRKFLIIISIIMGITCVPLIIPTNIVNAADIWCSNDGYYDYYVDDTSLGLTASGLHYIDVDCSNGERIQYCFEYWKGDWKYNILNGNRKTDGFSSVTNSKLANDILYVTLQVKKYR